MAKKIYINPGHSDKDPGAVGYETERVLNIKVSNYQRDYLLDKLKTAGFDGFIVKSKQ